MENGLFLKLPPLNNGEMLKGIFEYQRTIIKEYQSRGKLPKQPIDLSKKEDQQFIRKTIGWIIEEMVESQKEQAIAWEIFKTSVFTDAEPKEKIKTHLLNAFVEYADVLHFMVELFIYCNIDEDDILQYYYHKSREKQLEPLYFGEGLKSSFAWARNENITNNDTRVSSYQAFTINPQKENPSEPTFKIGPELFNQMELHAWSVVYTLVSAQNRLKAKDWRETDVKVNVNEFQSDIIIAWQILFKTFDLLGLDEYSMYTLYENKNLENQKRILNKY